MRWHHTLPPSTQVTPHKTSNFPHNYFHATHAKLRVLQPQHTTITDTTTHRADNEPDEHIPEENGDGRGYEEKKWTSRNQRKQRYVRHTPTSGTPRYGSSVWHKLANLSRLEYWNVSWWVAIAFTLGSVIWVINALAAFLPFCDSRHFQAAPELAGWTAWLGATVFEVGSVLGILEAWNRADVAGFGGGVKRLFGLVKHRGLDDSLVSAEKRDVEHGDAAASSEDSSTAEKTRGKKSKKSKSDSSSRWIWFTTDTKYWHEAGFLAAFFQLCGASIFWISGFTAIPAIQEAIISTPRVWNGAFWTPQVIGGSGFIISSTFIMLESQKKWYKPEPLDLGWQIGFWNLIGGIGFTLCGIFGYGSLDPSSWQAYQSSLSTFWGSWAFLIGSAVQWYESVNPLK